MNIYIIVLMITLPLIAELLKHVISKSELLNKIESSLLLILSWSLVLNNDRLLKQSIDITYWNNLFGTDLNIKLLIDGVSLSIVAGLCTVYFISNFYCYYVLDIRKFL